MNLDSSPGMEPRWANLKCAVPVFPLRIITMPGQRENLHLDGWFKTGDIVTIGEDGFIEIKDRSKDLIKSGGEWISSLALENSLMEHPSVLEAAVIAVPDEKWMERPFAFIVPKEGKTISPDELREFLAGRFAKFWIPEGYAIMIPSQKLQ